MRTRAALLALLLLLAGCSRRDRANPLDPGNPNTGGGPTGFEALAGFSLVTLQWDAQPTLAIDGFQILRLAPGDSVYRPLGGVLPRTSGRQNDTAVLNGATYHYRIAYVVHGSATPREASDLATPGPLRVWVADPGLPGLERLTPDGRHVLLEVTGPDVGTPVSLALDPVNQLLWLSDLNDPLVRVYEPASGHSTLIQTLNLPYSIALDPGDQSAYVCDEGNPGKVGHFFPSGGNLGVFSPLEAPDGIAVNHLDRSIWVCELSGDRVRHFGANGTPLSATTVAAPTRVAVDSVSGVAWVTSADLGLITRISATGQVVDSLHIADAPLGITIDRPRDRVWIADFTGNRVLAVQLSTRTTQFVVSGVFGARDVAVDPLSGEAWVVAKNSASVVRISPQGAILTQVTGLGSPAEIRLDPGGN